MDKNKKVYIHLIEPALPIENAVFCDIKNIHVLQDNEYSQVYIMDLLDYVNDEKIKDLVLDITQKLKTDGQLFIQATDSKNLAFALVYGQINNDIYKNIIYGTNKKNTHTMGEIKNLLSTIDNLNITKCKYINTMQYYIECQKNAK